MNTTRRAFIGSAAVASLPISAAASAVIAPVETQEAKCSRLLIELLVECRKLPRTKETMFGWNAAINLPDGTSYASHSMAHDDKDYSEQLTVLIKRPEGET
ncbi:MULTISPECIES: hypothetical protein [unclassified Rhizobium]|uniref:hypothetical protein n=1 Tax=unclassified Rhizobium TaxID=2613769 RepID=UPI00288B0D9E|nr:MULTISPECIES: hypothetical protein [unclassified Rhizobium]